MSCETASDMAAPSDPRQVLVTVTTVRLTDGGEIEATRRHVAEGEFDQAVLDALKARLEPWALDQVLGRIRARRPSLGEPVEYEGWFSTRRQLLVAVEPASETESASWKKRALKGLFLPEADPAAAGATAA